MIFLVVGISIIILDQYCSFAVLIVLFATNLFISRSCTNIHNSIVPRLVVS